MPRSGKIFTVAGETTATPANIKAGFCATGIRPFNTSIIPNETFVSSLVTHNDDAQVLVTMTETPAPVLLPQKTQKTSPVPGIARAERDGTRAETRFRLSPKRTSPFKSVGGVSSSRLLAVEVCASA